MTLAHLNPAFRAQSIALLGLSGNPSKMTGAPLEILRLTGFTGRLFPVNPNHKEIGGLPAFPDVASVPEVPDVALIMLPAAACAQAVRDCAAKGIKACVITSSGFEETEGGAVNSAALRQAANDCDMAVVGPNCEGLWSVRSRVFLTFGSAARRSELHHAPVAVLSQSGAIAGAVARHLQEMKLGCAYVVSVGNEAVLTIADYLEWAMEQDDVRVVVLFIEGIRDGTRLLHLIRQAVARGLRIVALKSGNSQEGSKAAASHTGKIASAFNIYQDLLSCAGVVLVDSLTDLISAAEVLVTAPDLCRHKQSGGVSVFSIPGGTRAMTVDHLQAHGVPMAVFSQHTVTSLETCLPGFGCVENPTDLTGQVLSSPHMFNESLSLIARDPQTEVLIVQVANKGPQDVMRRIDLLGDVAAETGVPVVITFLGDALPPEARALLRARRLLCAQDPAEAARFIGWLYKTAPPLVQEDRQAKSMEPIPFPNAWQQMAAWLTAASMKIPRWRVLQAHEAASTACRSISYPVAVKALPGDSDHKTELGLLSLNVHTADEVDREAARIRKALDLPTAGILIQEMAPAGVEVVLAASCNPDFGPVIAIGMGGVAVELFEDIAWVALPASEADIRAALSTLRLARLLAGFRGKPRADTDALVQAAIRFGDAFLATAPRASEIEINPLIVLPDGQGVIAVDALFKTATETTHV